MARRVPTRRLRQIIPDLPQAEARKLGRVFGRWLSALQRAQLQEYFDDEFLIGGQVYNSTSQTITTATDTLLSWDTVRFDAGGLYNASDPTRLTAPVSGLYWIGGNFNWAASAIGLRRVQIRVDGVDIRGQVQQPTGGTAVEVDLTMNRPIYLAQESYVEFLVHQTSGGNLSLQQKSDYAPEVWMIHQRFVPETAFS